MSRRESREYKIDVKADLIEDSDGVFRLRLPRVIIREPLVLLLLDSEEVRYLSADRAIEIARQYFQHRQTAPSTLLSEIQELKRQLEERDKIIQELRKQLEEKDKVIEELQRKLREFESRLAAAKEVLVERREKRELAVSKEECESILEMKPEERARLEEEAEKGSEEAALKLAKYVICSSTPVAITRQKAREIVKKILEESGYNVVITGTLIAVS
jgi:chromosome segregation ATPase